MDLTLRLREATADLHGQIEQLPVARAIIGGCVGRAEYTWVLGQLYHIHATLEAELAAQPELHQVFKPGMVRLPAIRRDLHVLGVPFLSKPVTSTALLTARMRELSARRPSALFGSLYILEGSRMGSMLLVTPLSQALGVRREPGRGLDYHLDGTSDRPLMWQKFKGDLLAFPLDAAGAVELVDMAVYTMAALRDVYAAAKPIDGLAFGSTLAAADEPVVLVAEGRG